MEVPPDLVRVSNALFELRDPLVVLARLVGDSEMDLLEPDPATGRHLEFRTADDAFVISAHYSAAEATLWLDCNPPLDCPLIIQQRGQSLNAHEIRSGSAVATHLPSGWTSLVVLREAQAGGAVRTSWTLL